MRSSDSIFAWHGWQLVLPHRWSPVKIEGGYDKGYVLFADLHRPRLGLRWKKLKRNADVPASVQKTLVEELGKLAAGEAKELRLGRPELSHSTLFMEPQPPGRDVWVAHSSVSDRLVELIYHSHRRERALAERLVPTLIDLPKDRPLPWSVFELSCMSPVGMELTAQRMNAGDLTLVFEAHKKRLVVRQIAVARLALGRKPVEKWLGEQMWTVRRWYRPVGKASEVKIEIADRTLAGVQRGQVRRRRFFFKWRVSRSLVTWALHDEARDRLVLAQASDEAMGEEAIRSVGWAREG